MRSLIAMRRLREASICHASGGAHQIADRVAPALTGFLRYNQDEAVSNVPTGNTGLTQTVETQPKIPSTMALRVAAKRFSRGISIAALRRASSDQDVRSVLTANAVYEVHSHQRILRNWQLSGLAMARTGLPALSH